jgi:hypothetical protein
MLQHWDDWKPCLESVLSPEPTVKIPKPYIQKGEPLSGRRDPIQEFNQATSVTTVLLKAGYKQVGKNRLIRSGSTSKAPGVTLMQSCADGIERIFSHGGDTLNDGYAHDAFDCHKILNCAGDHTSAMNWSAEITAHNQDLFRQARAAAQLTKPFDVIELIKNGNAKKKPEPEHGQAESEQQEPTSTFNATLDNEHKYCTVDLLRHVADDHILKRLSKQIAAETHLPVNTVFLMGAAVFSSMLSRKYAVLYEDGEMLPLGLYVVAEQPSGTGKSRCLKTFQKPFEATQKKMLIEALKKLTPLEGRVSNKETLSEFEAVKYLELKDKVKRLSGGLFVTNATPEGLETTLSVTNGFFSAISSEQGLFNSLLGKSYKSDSASNNNDVVLNGFDGGHVNSIRTTRKGYAGNVIGGVACFAQSGAIETVLSASNGTGLSERFLMLAEPHSLGKRDHMATVERDPLLTVNYGMACEFIENVLDTPRDLDDLSGLVISKAGHLKIKQYRQKIEPGLLDGGKFSHVALMGAAGKVDMQIMKFASTLHVMDGGEFIQEITDSHIVSAIHITNELLEANLKLCTDKGIIGLKAEFTAILVLFENNPSPRTERNIIQSKSQKIPFKDFSGNKSALIKATLCEMVAQRLLTKLAAGSVIKYQVSQ